MLNKIEKFLVQFPTDATSWMQATDEVRDLARASREMLDEYDDIKVEAVDFTVIKTPAEWNTLGRKSIMRNYDMMSPRTQLLFFERFEEKFCFNLIFLKRLTELCHLKNRSFAHFILSNSKKIFANLHYLRKSCYICYNILRGKCKFILTVESRKFNWRENEQTSCRVILI